VETWRGASTPRDCEDPPRLHRMPVQDIQEGSRSRATVGRSYAARGPASCLPRLEGSHPGPARATVSARRLEPAPTASVSVNPGARRLGGPGIPCQLPGVRRPHAVARLVQPSARSRGREGAGRATVGSARAERTAHEGEPAFRGWESARTARQDREMRARFVAIYHDRPAPNGRRSLPHVWTPPNRP
jgi:hypothetical protein